MTRIYIVRHGETTSNEQGKFAGHTDFPLNAVGLEQAEQTAAALADTPIDAVYSSDLSRAMDTAKAHAARHGLAVIPDRALREVYCGAWENRKFDDLRERYADAFVHGFLENYLTFVFPGGEAAPEAGERFYAEVRRLAAENDGKTLIVVSHGGVIRSFWAKICGADLDKESAKYPFPSNASYSITDFDGEKFIPVEYSHDAHLTTVTNVRA